MSTNKAIIQAKIDAVKSLVVAGYTAKEDFNSVCGRLVPAVMDGKISFAEIVPLVKYIGESEGFVVSLATRRDNCKIDLNKDESNIYKIAVWADLSELADTYAVEYDLDTKWVIKEIKRELKERDYPIPRDTTISGWKLSILNCLKRDINMPFADIVQTIKGENEKCTNAEHYVKTFLNVYLTCIDYGKSLTEEEISLVEINLE